MNENQQRTDLALESKELADVSGKVEGVESEESIRHGLLCQKVCVNTQEAQNRIGKPAGCYYTLNISGLLRRESGEFQNTVEAVAEVLKSMLPDDFREKGVLMAGLGNRDITPDNVGPLTAKHVLVTRHLKMHDAESFKMLNPVSVITPGVMGTSGIESADYIKWVCGNLHPACVVTVDALAAKELQRLCTTIQITDTGITPGSGVGNSRSEISRDTLGVPVIAVGLPTVADIGNMLASEYAVNEKDRRPMIVTPRNIDAEVSCAARVIAYGINLALHDEITIEDVDMLVD